VRGAAKLEAFSNYLVDDGEGAASGAEATAGVDDDASLGATVRAGKASIEVD